VLHHIGHITVIPETFCSDLAIIDGNEMSGTNRSSIHFIVLKRTYKHRFNIAMTAAMSYHTY